MKERIGNDIVLTLDLNGSEPNDLNVLSAKAYIVNRSAKEHALNEHKRINQFMSRFPIGRDFIDPKLNGIEPDEHNIHMLGDVPYHCYPRPHIENKYGGFGAYPKWDKKYLPIIEEYGLTSYQAEVRFTDQRGVIQVFFPAEAQIYTGDYDVIVVAKLYQGGYRDDNTRVITVDYSNYFTLIPNTEWPGPEPQPGQWVFGGTFPVTLS